MVFNAYHTDGQAQACCQSLKVEILRMTFLKHNGEILPERRGVFAGVFDSLSRNGNSFRIVRKGRRFGLSRCFKLRFLHWIFFLTAVFSTYFAIFGLRYYFNGKNKSFCCVDFCLKQRTELDVIYSLLHHFMHVDNRYLALQVT